MKPGWSGLLIFALVLVNILSLYPALCHVLLVQIQMMCDDVLMKGIVDPALDCQHPLLSPASRANAVARRSYTVIGGTPCSEASCRRRCPCSLCQLAVRHRCCQTVRKLMEDADNQIFHC
jgi:hypothetical protein